MMGCTSCGKSRATVTAFKVIGADGKTIGNTGGYPTRAEATAVQVQNPGSTIKPVAVGLNK